MRIVVRGADVGYSKGITDGFLKTVDEGITTSAYLYLDSEWSEYALKELQKRPWISVEWQAQLKGRPVLPPADVPTLVNETGRFKWDKKHPEQKNEFNYKEAIRELKSELDLCKKYIGRYPETAEIDSDNTLISQAIREVCKEHGIPYNTVICDFFNLSEDYQQSNYHYVGIMPHLVLTKEQLSDTVRIADIYDCAEAIMKQEYIEGKDYLISIHPGFIDDDLWNKSHSYTLPRIKDVIGACDPRLKAWIKENRHILVNQRDILEGSNEYQEHLKRIGSDLYMG